MSIKKLSIVFFLSLFSQMSHAAVVTDTVKWLSWDEAMDAIAVQPKKLMVEVYTDWCVWCKKMDTETFTEEHIVNYINDNFYPVKFNANLKEDVEYKGQVYKFVKSGNTGYHELAAELLNDRLSYPAIVFMDEKSNIIQTISGYKSPMQFMQMVTYFGENQHRTTPWSTYKKSFVPKQMMIKHEEDKSN